MTGDRFFARLSASPVRGDVGTVLIFRDIPERKMQENALKESNQKLALLSSIIRHDLLNQVMVLRGYLSFAAEDTEDPALIDRPARPGSICVSRTKPSAFPWIIQLRATAPRPAGIGPGH